ncbi:outer membrane beta-barrel protein [Paludibacterium purpuratum]|uniref:Outer membrane protein with beta-barrel domain n=1 Tax=Paludibacterium purpuratum TaxID=1144873 RepID=A0A4R7B3I7_9NEIS|nr:outer membrane beta-barrel protein [Paludibacterium purpuratum]TDR76545.1 outer membrane protein with beta-barrel domain [Paludibacterium purpuratum]
MHTTRLLVLTACTLASGAALAADNDPFTGPAIAVGISMAQLDHKATRKNEYTPSVGPVITNTTSDSASQHTAVPILDFSWTERIAPTWVAGAGINLEPGKRSSTDYLTKDNTYGQGPKFTLSQHTAVYALAGKQLGDNWLLFGKLGYHQAKGQFEGWSSGKLRGIGLGAGATRAWKSGWQLRMEGEYIGFNQTQVGKATANSLGNTLTSTISNKPRMWRMNVMAGYNF